MEAKLKIKGMSCMACEKRIVKALEQAGAESASANAMHGTGSVRFDESKTSEKKLLAAVSDAGYEAHVVSRSDANAKDGAEGSEKQGASGSGKDWFSDLPKKLFLLLSLFALFALLVMAGKVISPMLGSADSFDIGKNAGMPLLFLVGLGTGFHCIAMCGGFAIGASKDQGNAGLLKYLGGKLISYTLIGALFGLLGALIAITLEMRAAAALLGGIFLVAYGLGNLDVLPKIVIRLPSPVAALAAKSSGHGPFGIGLMNGLMLACGPLFAMYVYAAGTGSPLAGGLALFAFGLGTLVVMALFAFAFVKIGQKYASSFAMVSAIAVILLGMMMLANGAGLLGIVVPGLGGGAQIAGACAGAGSCPGTTIDVAGSGSGAVILPNSGAGSGAGANASEQVIRMEVTASGWNPDAFVLRKGVPVKWIINVKELTGCNREIIVPKYGLDIKLRQGEQTVEFTPNETGTVGWSCWMGMIRGQFTVVENNAGTAGAQQTGGAGNALQRAGDELVADPDKQQAAAHCGGGSSCGCGCGGVG